MEGKRAGGRSRRREAQKKKKKKRRTKLEVRKGCIRTSAGALSLSECHVPWVYLWDEAACIARACVCAPPVTFGRTCGRIRASDGETPVGPSQRGGHRSRTVVSPPRVWKRAAVCFGRLKWEGQKYGTFQRPRLWRPCTRVRRMRAMCGAAETTQRLPVAKEAGSTCAFRNKANARASFGDTGLCF